MADNEDDNRAFPRRVGVQFGSWYEFTFPPLHFWLCFHWKANDCFYFYAMFTGFFVFLLCFPFVVFLEARMETEEEQVICYHHYWGSSIDRNLPFLYIKEGLCLLNIWGICLPLQLAQMVLSRESRLQFALSLPFTLLWREIIVL